MSLRIALNGFGKRRLTSVETLRRYFLRALTENFQTVPYDRTWTEKRDTVVDGIVTYFDRSFWKPIRHPDTSLIYAVHGDAVSHYPRLRENLKYLHTSDCLIVNCTSDRNILSALMGARPPLVSVLHFPVDTAVFRPLDRIEARKELGLDPEMFLVGFVGRLVPQKNLHVFLRMLAAIRAELWPERVEALVVGGFATPYPVLDFGAAGYQEYVRTLSRRLEVEASVRYTGEVEHARLPVYYSAMDLLIHPTNNLEENFGLAPVEAMACGVPVVATAYGGLKDTVVSGTTGFLMESWVTPTGIRMDTAAGISAASEILTDPEVRSRYSRSSVRRVHDLYSYDLFATRLCAAVETSVARRHKKGPQRVSFARTKLPARGVSFLPETSPSWAELTHAVREYASRSIPAIAPQDRLFPVGDFLARLNGEWCLDDPAWPASVRLQGDHIRILEMSHDAPTVERLESNGIKVEDIRQLVAWGLVVVRASQGADAMPDRAAPE
jgi:glycosyltransferase involved in cell wall biosynthesis